MMEQLNMFAAMGIGQKPLFGHHSGRKSKTFWGCFMKLEADDE